MGRPAPASKVMHAHDYWDEEKLGLFLKTKLIIPSETANLSQMMPQPLCSNLCRLMIA